MNKQSIVSGFKIATLSLFFATAFSTSSFATDSNNATDAKSKAVNIKYVANAEDGYIFNVKYENLTGNEFEMIIKDETGEIIYQKSFDDKSFNKKFQLSKSLVKAVFIIRPEHQADQSFEVAIQSRITEDVVVSRL